MDKDFKMDMTPLTEEQMKVMKKLIGFSQIFAGQIKDIMVHHGLWHKCFKVEIAVDPTMAIFSKEVTVRRKVIDGNGIYDECIDRYCGKEKPFDEWRTCEPATSREFIHLFDAEADGTGAEKGNTSEHPLPADGLWVGTDYDSDPVDSRNAVNEDDTAE